MKRIAATIFILLLMAFPARADTSAAELILGYAVLTGDAGDISDDAICFGAYGAYFIDPAIASALIPHDRLSCMPSGMSLSIAGMRG